MVHFMVRCFEFQSFTNNNEMVEILNEVIQTRPRKLEKHKHNITTTRNGWNTFRSCSSDAAVCCWGVQCIVTVIRMLWIAREKRIFSHSSPLQRRERKHSVSWVDVNRNGISAPHVRTYCSCFCHQFLLLSAVLTKDVCGCCLRHDELDGLPYYTKTRFDDGSKKEREKEVSSWSWHKRTSAHGQHTVSRQWTVVAWGTISDQIHKVSRRYFFFAHIIGPLSYQLNRQSTWILFVKEINIG